MVVSLQFSPVHNYNSAYLCRRHSPHFVVVRPHEEIGDTLSHVADDPLVEILGLCVGNASLESGVNHAVQALYLLLLGQHGNVVLEGVRDPLLLAAHVGNALVSVPVGLFGESLVDTVVEVLVVGEDNVATDIVKLSGALDPEFAEPVTSTLLTKPSGVVSVEARPPGISFESTIIHEGPSCIYEYGILQRANQRRTYQLLEALCGTNSSRTGANYENIDLAVGVSVAVICLLRGRKATHTFGCCYRQ